MENLNSLFPETATAPLSRFWFPNTNVGLPDFLALYARGLSTRDISAQLEELYGSSISPALMSEVTDSVLEEVKA